MFNKFQKLALQLPQFQKNQAIPPLWLLERPAEMGITVERQLRFGPNARARRHPDSLTLEMEFAGEENSFVSDNVFDMVLRTASEEDERTFVSGERSLQAGLTRQYTTLIWTNADRNEQVPVIGPGGKASFYQNRAGFNVDLTIRRRSAPRASDWRSPTEILSRLLRLRSTESEMPVHDQSPFEMSWSFGYFELSKYELQEIMRPVFLFSLTLPQDPEGRWPGWQTTLVEPATTSPGIGLQEGLGAWSE